MRTRNPTSIIERLLVLAVLLASAVAAPRAGSADEPQSIATALDAYIARPEPLYQWERAQPKAGEGANATGMELMGALTAGVTTSDLKLTSQRWQGHIWTHRVQVFRPAELQFPDTALLYVPYGGGSASETVMGQALANLTGATVVNLFHVPNQPLFDKREDALIAYTFERFLETGDATWPLLFPMTKSVVKAMDAVQEFSAQEWKQPITKFVVTGASKRGWTTWLTAAADKRVAGIMPQVYDNLNLTAQMPHQLETWGEYSEQIKDYTRLGLQAKLTTPRGAQLAAMVDPYTYRERLTMPKLIINGTNDRYWTLDALNFYRDDLKGATSVLYLPNAGHGLGDGQQIQSLIGSAVSWFRRVAAQQGTPWVKLAAVSAPRGARRFLLTTDTGAPVKEARLWVAHSATRDFRSARWQALPMNKNADGAYVAEVPPAGDAKYAAAIGEIELPGAPGPLPLPLRLSSSVVLWNR